MVERVDIMFDVYRKASRKREHVKERERRKG